MTAQKLFGTRDLYEILQLERGAQIQDGKLEASIMFLMTHSNDVYILSVKRKYYNLALVYHPDRVAQDKREEASNKFNIVHNAYSILSDAEKKKLYDNGSDILFTKTTIAAQWEHYLKPVNNNDIEKARNKYQGSEREDRDLIREFKIGNGSMTHLLNTIPFMRVEDKNRILESLKELMSTEKIPKLPIKRVAKK